MTNNVSVNDEPGTVPIGTTTSKPCSCTIYQQGHETITNSGVINLPSSRTLGDYKHMLSTEVGFFVEADRQIIELLAQKDDLAKYGVVMLNKG